MMMQTCQGMKNFRLQMVTHKEDEMHEETKNNKDQGDEKTTNGEQISSTHTKMIK